MTTSTLGDGELDGRLDRELLQTFRSGTLDAGTFSHREHLRLTWLLLRDHSLLEVLHELTSGLREFARSAGSEEHYHETITWAFVVLIHQRMQHEKAAEEEESADFSTFLSRNVDLWRDGAKVLECYYRPETLAAPLARQTFLLPDRAIEPAPVPQSAPSGDQSAPPNAAHRPPRRGPAPESRR